MYRAWRRPLMLMIILAAPVCGGAEAAEPEAESNPAAVVSATHAPALHLETKDRLPPPEGLSDESSQIDLEFEEVFSYSPAPYWCENHLAVADYDRDGLKDIVLLETARASSSPPWVSRVIMLHAEEDWSFTDRVIREFPDGDYGYWIQSSDLDRDGWPDLVVREGSTTQVLLNDGSGSFDEVWSVSPGFYSLRTADMNDDGAEDLVLGNGVYPGPSTVQVLLNDGTGRLFHPVWESSVSYHPNNVLAPDLNLDGAPDIAVVEIYDGILRTYLNDGVGTSFTEVIRHEMGERTFTLAAGDVNGDGLPDLATSVGWGEVRVFLGNGDGTVRLGWTSSDLHQAVLNLALEDFDRDGYDDLFAGAFGSGGLFIYRNQRNDGGEAGFELAWNGALGESGYTGTVADVDDDGWPDLIVGGPSQIHVLRNKTGDGDPIVLLKELSLRIEGLDAPWGFKNSLSKKLNKVELILGGSGPWRSHAAADALKAFVNEVEAQRGKFIPASAADALIQGVGRILDLLSTR